MADTSLICKRCDGVGSDECARCNGTGLEPVAQPMLGLATTRHLLNELAVRMEVTQNSLKGRDLGRLCREAIANLDAGVLDYRTVDS